MDMPAVAYDHQVIVRSSKSSIMDQKEGVRRGKGQFVKRDFGMVRDLNAVGLIFFFRKENLSHLDFPHTVLTAQTQRQRQLLRQRHVFI